MAAKPVAAVTPIGMTRAPERKSVIFIVHVLDLGGNERVFLSVEDVCLSTSYAVVGTRLSRYPGEHEITIYDGALGSILLPTFRPR